MKNLKVSIIIKKLKEDGWKKVHQSGSHRQFKHPIKKGKVTVNGNDITISASINGTYVPYSFSNADTHPEIGEAIKNGTWGVAESTTTAAASLKNGNGVIKATGDNAGIAMLVAVVAIAGTMGVAVRKSRDAE